jgi:Rap1a immunity proteins
LEGEMRGLTKWCTVAVAVVPACFMAAPAQGGYHSGNSLLDECNARYPDRAVRIMQEGVCTAYITGVTDSLENARQFCLTAGVQQTQQIDVVKNYLRAHPETRHYVAAPLVSEALKEKFPCN